MFRSAEESQQGKLENKGFWIDVNASAINDFHWIDGSSLAGNFVYKLAGISYCFMYSMKIIIREREMCSV